MHAIFRKAQPLQARVLEVLLRAVALPLGEDAKHQVNLTVQRCQFAGNLHNDILFELLAVDQVSCSFLEQVLSLGTLESHDVNLDFKLANLGLRVDGADGVPLVHRAARDQRCQRDLAHTDHVIVLCGTCILIESNARDWSIVVEQDHFQALFLEVLNGFGVDHDFVAVSVVESWIGAH